MNLRMGILLPALALAALAGGAAADTGREYFERGEYAAAVAAWTPLAESGDRWAMAGLGHVAAMRGEDEEAARWYHGAAVRGHAAAQILLASAYLEGRGVARDPSRAYAWYHIAADNGHAGAAAARDLAARWLTPQRQAEARALARRWLTRGMPESP